MHKKSKVYVAGHTGLVGSAVARKLEEHGYRNVLTRTHAELDLMEHAVVRDFFQSNRPEYVVLAAAKVGGIVANNTYPAQFIEENLTIQCNVIREARRAGVKRLLFLGSSCIYPRECPQPMREEHLLTGPLEPTNQPYAIAKIAGIEMCWAYNRQYGTQYLALMPTNMYGTGDNYDLETSHVMPALIRKIHEAKIQGTREIVIWGSGKPRREFLYSDDLGEACVFLLRLSDDRYRRLVDPSTGRAPLINVGYGEDQTITELAETIKEVLEYRGSFVFDSSKPDGTYQKLLSSDRIRELGWQPSVSLRCGVVLAYEDFKKREGHLAVSSHQ